MKRLPVVVAVIAVLALATVANPSAGIPEGGDLPPKNGASDEQLALSVGGWAALLEMNDFPSGWSDLPVGFINSERFRAVLLSFGWQDDHIHTVRDNLTIVAVQDAVAWLENNTQVDEIALLYIFTHGNWMRNVLQWNTWFSADWEKVNTTRKLLMVDTCFAEEFIIPSESDPSGHVCLAGCSVGELSWCGLEEEGLPIIGSVWNYYFTSALSDPSADADKNGEVSVEEAFNFSTPLTQKYMNETVFSVPEFLETYHSVGVYPENYAAYPHPKMDDGYVGQLFIPEFVFPQLLPLIMAALVSIIAYRRRYCNALRL